MHYVCCILCGGFSISINIATICKRYYWNFNRVTNSTNILKTENVFQELRMQFGLNLVKTLKSLFSGQYTPYKTL